MLPTDFAPPTTLALGRVADRRARQFWDPDHVMALKMAADAHPPQPEQDCCSRNDILWDLAAVYPSSVRWTDRLPPATLFNGPVADVVGAIGRAVEHQPAKGSVVIPPPVG
jgi:hypothetical protein